MTSPPIHRRAPAYVAAPARAETFLREAREHERGGRVADAIQCYTAAVEAATGRENAPTLAEALRRLGNVRRRRHEVDSAVALYRQSHEVALSIGDSVLAAEALNALALVHLERGEWEDARKLLHPALAIGAESAELRGRIEQNLGVISNIQGDFRDALTHYQRSLEAFRAGADERGCAIAYHNLGMISADQRRWEDAERYFQSSLETAELTGDVQLRAHVLLNRTEVHLARQQFERARHSAEEALGIFDRLGARDGKSLAYKFLGVLYRETGQPVLAEARLREAVSLAQQVGGALYEAEASRELALLYQAQGRSQDALTLLNASHRLFGRLRARADLVDVASKVAHLEELYLAIVREWGRSIESSDSYTFGHSERVASYAATVASALGLEATELTTIRVGAYLHDLGKVRVPHEILNKPGRLTQDELQIMQQHPVYGLEMLATVEFPWDIKPIIRSHHERVSGGGYPDRLCGDEIPLAAQIICVVDVFDAMTTTRSYRPAMSHESALAEIQLCRQWWRPEVLSGFMETLGRSR